MKDPLRVRVIGRSGAGRQTVARALCGAGIEVAAVGQAAEADVDVYVFVETLTADDRTALAASARPTVAVLNKADLAGFGDGGLGDSGLPDRCRKLRRETGVPVLPFSALLAFAGSAPQVVERVLGPLLTVASGAAPDEEAREFLAADLDVFGTAVAVAALRAGSGSSAVAGLLQRVSGIDDVLTEIDRAGAVVRYRRSVYPDRVTAARAVLDAAGVPAPASADPVGLALHWYRYARGPVGTLHRACALDVARGALRRWAEAGGRPAALP